MELTINNTKVGLSLTDPQEKYILGMAAAAQREEESRFKLMSRRYTMSKKPTEGLDYDDRLYVRLGCCPNTAYALLRAGAIRKVDMGNKIAVSESAVLRYMDPEGYAHLMGLSESFEPKLRKVG